jgi:hypothetical protein
VRLEVLALPVLAVETPRTGSPAPPHPRREKETVSPSATARAVDRPGERAGLRLLREQPDPVDLADAGGVEPGE